MIDELWEHIDLLREVDTTLTRLTTEILRLYGITERELDLEYARLLTESVAGEPPSR